MRASGLVCIFAVLGLSGVARAEDPKPKTTSFDVPVETIKITPHSGKLLNDTIGIGGFVASTFTYSTGSSSSVFGVGKSKTHEKVSLTLTKEDKTPVLATKCVVDEVVRSTFFVKNTNSDQVYICKPDENNASGFTFEMVFPDSGQTSVGLGFVTITKAKGEDYKRRLGMMSYHGHAYDSAPTGYNARGFGGRAVTGYAIRRDGKVIGEVDFSQTGSTHNHGSLTLPITPSEDREAVIIMAANLFLMPDPDENSR